MNEIVLNHFMQKEVNKYLEGYKEDVEIDFINLKEYFKSKKYEFIWMCRKNGTNLFEYKELFFIGSLANVSLKYFKDFDKKVYKITITRIEGDSIYGSIKKVDFSNLLKDIIQKEKKISSILIRVNYTLDNKDLNKDVLIKETNPLLLTKDKVIERFDGKFDNINSIRLIELN